MIDEIKKAINGWDDEIGHGSWVLNGDCGDCKEGLMSAYLDSFKTKPIFFFFDADTVGKTFPDRVRNLFALITDKKACDIVEFDGWWVLKLSKDDLFKSSWALLDVFTVLSRLASKKKVFTSLKQINSALTTFQWAGYSYSSKLLKNIILNFDAFCKLNKNKKCREYLQGFNGLYSANLGIWKKERVCPQNNSGIRDWAESYSPPEKLINFYNL